MCAGGSPISRWRRATPSSYVHPRVISLNAVRAQRRGRPCEPRHGLLPLEMQAHPMPTISSGPDDRPRQKSPFVISVRSSTCGALMVAEGRFEAPEETTERCPVAATTPRSEIDVRAGQQADVRAAREPGRVRAARQVGVLGHLARNTRENARAHGMVFVAHELFRVESLLWAIRAHLLETSSELRGASDNAVLGMLEMLIAREAMSRPVRPRDEPQSEPVAGCRMTADVAGARRHGPRTVRPAASACGRRRWAARDVSASELLAARAPKAAIW